MIGEDNTKLDGAMAQSRFMSGNIQVCPSAAQEGGAKRFSALPVKGLVSRCYQTPFSASPCREQLPINQLIRFIVVGRPARIKE